MSPFVVDIYHVSTKLEVTKKRHEADTVEEAERKLEMYSGLGDVTRIVIGRRSGGRNIDVLRVWNRPAF